MSKGKTCMRCPRIIGFRDDALLIRRATLENDEIKDELYFVTKEQGAVTLCAFCGARVLNMLTQEALGAGKGQEYERAITLLNLNVQELEKEALKYRQAIKVLTDVCALTSACCDEALSDAWDRGDEGFEAMRDNIADAIKEAGGEIKS